MTTKKELYYLPVIDSLRGLAALMVCIYHFVSTTTDFFDPSVRQLFSVGKHGVQIFFVISGVVIPLSMLKDNYTNKKFPLFFSKRLVRIEPPYLVSLILVIAYTYIRNFVPGVNPVDLTPHPRDILYHIGYLVPFFKEAHWLTPVYWTLAIEFQYYLLISIILPLILKVQWSRGCVIFLLLISSALVKSPAFIFAWLPLFIMGIYSALYLTGRVKKIEFLLQVAFCFSAHSVIYSLSDAMFALGTVCVIILFPYFNSKTGKFFGKISYSLYLLHSIIGAAVINFMTRYGHTSIEKVLIVILGLLITISCSYFFYLFIERPSQTLSKTIKFKGQYKSDKEYHLEVSK